MTTISSFAVTPPDKYRSCEIFDEARREVAGAVRELARVQVQVFDAHQYDCVELRDFEPRARHCWPQMCCSAVIAMIWSQRPSCPNTLGYPRANVHRRWSGAAALAGDKTAQATEAGLAADLANAPVLKHKRTSTCAQALQRRSTKPQVNALPGPLLRLQAKMQQQIVSMQRQPASQCVDLSDAREVRVEVRANSKLL